MERKERNVEKRKSGRGRGGNGERERKKKTKRKLKESLNSDKILRKIFGLH